MKLRDIYKLVEVLHVEWQLGDEIQPTRIEIFQSEVRQDTFLVKVWQIDRYRLHPITAENLTKNDLQDYILSADNVADEGVLVDRTWFLDFVSDFKNPFQAEGVQQAREIVLEQLRKYEFSITGRRD
jgi:hypothetical protein